MSHYRSNLRDLEFNLFEVLDRGSVLGSGPAEDLDPDTARAMLSEVDHLARTKLAPCYAESDQNPPIYDPENRSVALPESFKVAFKAYMDSDWWRVELPAALDGQPTPPSLRWALMELVLGANAPIYMYSAGAKFAEVVHLGGGNGGTDRDRRTAKHMIDRTWGATMVLTEPDAGSDVGAGRTKAFPQTDGSWHLEGVKRFITSGDQDLTENIIHLVLARPVGVDGVGGPGTKGLSLFVVPKFHFDLETGELTGGRNGVFATNVEKKLGIKVSTTCELTFGEGRPAVGYLLGEVHNGIAQMFRIIEHARMMVGTKAIATLSTGYLNALDYAKERKQGADLLDPGKAAPRVSIIHHPDVRRSLMTQKAFTEGMRLLIAYTASFQDRVWIAESRGEHDHDAERINDLLLPIVKGYGSERSWVLLGTESLQTFGGSGFLTDYPLEQYVRDAKIDTLYEGTTAIQGQDLFFRKIVKDGGKAIGLLSAEINTFVESEGELAGERVILAQGVGDVTGVISLMINDISTIGKHPQNTYKVALNTTRLLMMLGDLVVAYLLVRAGDVAAAALAGGNASAADVDFYSGKVAAARFFVTHVLPKLAAERRIAEATDLSIMELPEAAF